jgi:signal peptidase I
MYIRGFLYGSILTGKFIGITMLSLGIIAALFLLCILLPGWILALSAKRAGSRRGRLRFGAAAMCLQTISSIAIMVASSRVDLIGGIPKLLLALGTFLVEIAAVFFILRSAFGLPTRRTWVLVALDFLLGFVGFGFALAVIRPYLIEAFVVPAASMSPTIGTGDRFICNKLISPRRWDLVTYYSPKDPSTVYCKRLVGLPGESVRFDGGELYVNNLHVVAPAVVAGQYHMAASRMPGRYADGQNVTLGSNEYFFVGDNGNLSYDSRFVGPSAGKSIVGVIDLMYWPIGRFRMIR